MTAHVTSWIADYGLVAVFVLMAIDAVLPAGGELVMLFAGGRPFIERHGRWLHIGPDRFARAERWFGRYGSAFVFFGRLTPLVRSFVSIPAGVLEFPLGRYTILTAAASLVWCLAFGVAGYTLGTHWDGLHHAFRYADYAAVAVLAAILATVLVRSRRAVAR